MLSRIARAVKLISGFSVACLAGCFLLSFTWSVSSQPLADTESYIRKINLKHIGQLLAMLDSADIKVDLKVKALHRITVLMKKNPSKIDKFSGKVISQIRSLVKQHATDTQTNFNYKVRQATCGTLGRFNTKKSSARAIAEIRKLFLNDTNGKVKTACARVLGDFGVVPDLATKVLVERLNDMLEKNKKAAQISHESSVPMIVILRSIGKLSSKTAFIPLMKVLQSGYPVAVKKEAEEAMEKISW